MTRRLALPTESEIRAALAELTATESNRGPTVLALARNLGLSNATFWRHFPQIAQEIADARRNARRSIHTTGPSPADAAKANSKVEAERLRRENSHLRDQLELAAAHIQHLTLENKALIEELEGAAKVTPIPRL